MTRAVPAVSRSFVLLTSTTGNVIACLETDRAEFCALATWGRDRVFRLAYEGDLGAVDGLPEAVTGAVYVEADCWRISMKSLNTPKPRKRRRMSAVILPFVRQVNA